MNNTRTSRSKCIDIVFVSYRIVIYAKGYQLIECKEIFGIDCRGFLIDIDIKDYFYLKREDYNIPRYSILDSLRRCYSAICNGKGNYQLDIFEVKKKL